MTCSQCWLHSSLLHTHRRASRLRISSSCDGTCSVSIWLKVTSCLPPPVLSIPQPSSPDPGYSMGSGKRCSATVSGSSEARLQQGHNWSAQASHYSGAPSPLGHHRVVRCQCRHGRGDCSTARCSCRSKNLSCTDLCLSVRHWESEWWGLSGWHVCCWPVTGIMMNESTRWWLFIL